MIDCVMMTERLCNLTLTDALPITSARDVNYSSKHENIIGISSVNRISPAVKIEHA